MYKNFLRPHHYRMPEKLPALVQLWILRILVPLGGHRHFITGTGFTSDSLAQIIGLENWVDPDNEKFDQQLALSDLRKLHRNAEAHTSDMLPSEFLDKNLERLSQLVGLSEADCRVLKFVVMLKNERLLDEAADHLGMLSTGKVISVLSFLLGLPEKDVRVTLGAHGLLAQSGLVSIDRSCRASLDGKLGLLSEGFADHIVSSDTDVVGLLRDTVSPAEPARLTLNDYEHIDASLSLMRTFVRHAVKTGKKGTNVFIYGEPGTGKSELVRVLAAELGCELFEVTAEDDDGDAIGGESRLRAFRAAQSFFGNRKAMIVFDEVEDVFNDAEMSLGGKSTAQIHKAWVNRMLEANPVPTIWLSNSARCLDAAFVRRFDIVVELPVPPKKHRARIIEGAYGTLLDAKGVDRLAEAEVLAPAVVTRVASVVHAIRGELGDERAASAIELLISNTLAAQGHPALETRRPERPPEVYDPAYVNADADLVALAAGVVINKTGRLCLYGPPGTGKTAFGRWLAERLDAPLHIKRGSDLMSKWVGDNEKNIARAFFEAQRDGAVLMIDEVDGFLLDRRHAQRGWEVSLVNEMLTQIESFSGVFVASTNLMDDLDRAALRRFDVKVGFRYMKPDQAWAMFKRVCERMRLARPGTALKRRVMRLDTLTPGDFASVVRRMRFQLSHSASDIVSALEGECELKGVSKSTMGFV